MRLNHEFNENNGRCIYCQVSALLASPDAECPFRTKTSVKCPRDTDGDGNCGQRWCPICYPEKFHELQHSDSAPVG